MPRRALQRSRSQNIVPCTVSQLLAAEQVDETFRICDVEISQVTVVGIIRHAEKAPTNILYKVDDMTAAPMDVRQWVDTDEAGGENVVVPPGTYVKVAGHLRSFQNKKSLVAFKIMPLENMNEFTTHILEIVNAHMILRKNLMVLNLIKSCLLPEGMSLQELKLQLHSMSASTIKCLHALKVGWKVCWAKAEEEEEQRHMAFLSHDISMLRLFETFLENTPQLTLLLYVILRTNKAELSQGLGIGTAFLCVSWSLLDYHQSLRSFLQDKYELSLSSSIVYFLWNLFLICPRILAVAVFALLWPYGVAVHFPLVWLAMFLWVCLQGTDFMESPGPEQLYRAMVAVILYFSWFNVAQGRTLHRSIIYHGFILVDSSLLALFWLWGRAPSDEHSYLVPVVSAALPCYLLGLGLRVTYYKWLHPNTQVQQEGGYDEVDANGGSDGLEFRSFPEPDLVNRRMQWLAQTHFPVSQAAQPHFLNGAAALESAV
ncbi:XK-related protein 8 [Willisornis vidua]|uniref:XK-related protein n=1 Tax=Willisornis vidua TaxID=1566151 RepID=A0ABQ9D744_9PASS|nr:XK-related protein 8 [Willisornis vidua]